MAVFDALNHRGPDRHAESWMPMEEVLRRVVARFPLAVIDRVRGDRRVLAEADNLVDLGMSPASELVALHRKSVGRVAYVTIREEVGGPQFDFFLDDCPAIIAIEYQRPEDRNDCRPLLEELAAALAEYDIVTEDIED